MRNNAKKESEISLFLRSLSDWRKSAGGFCFSFSPYESGGFKPLEKIQPPSPSSEIRTRQSQTIRKTRELKWDKYLPELSRQNNVIVEQGPQKIGLLLLQFDNP